MPRLTGSVPCRLQASSSCGLALGAKLHSFKSCAALTGAAGPLKLYWTLHSNKTLIMGISGTNPEGGYIGERSTSEHVPIC